MNTLFYAIKKDEDYYISDVKDWSDELVHATLFINPCSAAEVIQNLKGAVLVPVVLAEIVNE